MSSTRDLAFRALNQTNKEKKYFAVVIDDIDEVDYNGLTGAIDPTIIQGVTVNQRLGNHVFCTHAIVKLKLYYNNLIPPLFDFNTMRVIFGSYLGADIPDVTDILATPGTIVATCSFYAANNSGTFQILYDRIFVLSASGNRAGIRVDIDFPINKQLSYKDGAAETDPQNIRHFILLISDSAADTAAGPIFGLTYKIYYTDA